MRVVECRGARLALLVVLALLAMLAGSGCTGLTELVVTVDTDLPPDMIDRIRIQVDGFGPQPVVAATVPQTPLPLTTGLIHEGGPLGPISIAVTGYEEFDVVILERRARVFFVEDSVRHLRVNLLSRCLDVVCEEDETCGEGGCRPISVDPTELEEWTAPPPPLISPDAGVDAAEDASDASDAGDASDASDASDAADASDASGCMACSDGCATGCCTETCGAGDTCDLDCAAGCGCKVECRDTELCQLACDGAIECVMSCSAANGCSMECINGSQCLLFCERDSRTGCAFSRCDGPQTSCPDGSIVCNRPCGGATIGL